MMMRSERVLPRFYVQNTPNDFATNPSASNPSFSTEEYYHRFGSIDPPAAGIVSGDTKKPLSIWRKRKCGESRNMAEMRETLFKMPAMQPVDDVDPGSVKPPKRRNVRISKDPQSVAARRRRERISERIRVLQRLVPGGTQMDTASMLDEAIHYMKFLKKQIESMETAEVNGGAAVGRMDFPVSVESGSSVVVLPWEHQQGINYLR